MANKWLIFVSLLAVLLCASCERKRKEDKTKCPKVKAIRNFDLEGVSLKTTIKKTYNYCCSWLLLFGEKIKVSSNLLKVHLTF